MMRFAQTRPAACLLERVSVCLSLQEPVLLVGETGTGKTSTLQLLAHHTGNTLVVLNMNQQSDSADLLGGLVLHLFLPPLLFKTLGFKNGGLM